jgi:hypothetical protein
MHPFPLSFHHGHLFISVADQDWLLDTGAPVSFGNAPLYLGHREFRVADTYFGLDAEGLSTLANHPTAGLIGADILGEFDLILDEVEHRATFSEADAALGGTNLELEQFMGIPIIQATIANQHCRMIFDTGAQISYFQGEELAGFPAAGQVNDFFPGLGEFSTDTYLVDVGVGGELFTIRCGALPGVLGMTLMLAGAQGIIGNEVLKGRIVGFFPRRRQLVLAS